MNARPTDHDGLSIGVGGVPARAPVSAIDDAVLAPIRAGMRARSIADICDRLALPAFLIDVTGRVLHVGAAAPPLLDGEVSIAAGHLLGRTAAMNRAIARAVTMAIGGARDRDDGASPLASGLPVDDPSPHQLMRGIVILAGRDGRHAGGIAALRDALG